MSKYIITQNVADCIGCRACEVHCKEKNNPGTGAFFCRILEVASPATGSVPGIDFIYLGCFHCEKRRITGKSGPTAARTALISSTAKRERLAMLPP